MSLGRVAAIRYVPHQQEDLKVTGKKSSREISLGRRECDRKPSCSLVWDGCSLSLTAAVAARGRTH